jgi:hypothetical protein
METDEEVREDEEDQVFSPNIRPPGNGLLCFLHPDHACGPWCASYVTNPRLSNSSELNEQSSHCSLLLSAERVGRNVVILVEMMVRTERKRSAEEADRKQREQFSTTDASRSPFGGKHG